MTKKKQTYEIDLDTISKLPIVAKKKKRSIAFIVNEALTKLVSHVKHS